MSIDGTRGRFRNISVTVRCVITKSPWPPSNMRIHDDVMTPSILLALCEGNHPSPVDFIQKWPEIRSFDAFFSDNVILMANKF